MIEVLVICITVVLVASISSQAFHSWLKQRERERLTVTDKAELLTKFVEVEAKIREIKGLSSGMKRT